MQTQSASYFSGLRDNLTALAIDVVRARHIDAQTPDDELNIPDKADLRAGFSGRETFTAAPAGVPLATWALIGGGVLAGVIAFKKFV